MIKPRIFSVVWWVLGKYWQHILCVAFGWWACRQYMRLVLNSLT